MNGTNDESDNSVDNSINASKGGEIAIGSNIASNGGVNGTKDESDNSTNADAKNGGIAAIASTVTQDKSDNSSKAMASLGSSAANNGGTSTWTYSSSAVVSKASLSGLVTGNHVAYYLPANGGKGDSGSADGRGSDTSTGGTGGAGGSPLIDNSVSIDGGAMTNFAGLNAQNLNTGVGALQNASINVSASIGTLTLGQ